MRKIGYIFIKWNQAEWFLYKIDCKNRLSCERAVQEEVKENLLYFTADLHFNHEKIIQHVNRPFRNVEQMNRTLIKKWNEKISPQDDIYSWRFYHERGRVGCRAVIQSQR